MSVVHEVRCDHCGGVSPVREGAALRMPPVSEFELAPAGWILPYVVPVSVNESRLGAAPTLCSWRCMAAFAAAKDGHAIVPEGFTPSRVREARATLSDASFDTWLDDAWKRAAGGLA